MVQMKAKAITVENVSKSFRIYKERSSTLKDRMIYRTRNKYDEFSALDNVSLIINKGETVGLLGRNGSGKSTLLKLLTRILYPDQGNIVIKGKVSSLLELGAGFHPDFTGRENIFMNAAILGLTKRDIRSKLEQIIAFSELKEYIDNPVRNYSSGMYMRLAFSVAIMVEPDILLIDEVLAVGDAAFQQKCMDQLLGLKLKGTTIVFVSHDLGAMQKLCDRVVWINKGKIVSQGGPRQVVDQYLAFLGEEENKRLLEEQSHSHTKHLETTIEQVDDDESTSNSSEPNNTERWGNKNIEIIEVLLKGSDGDIKLGFMSGENMVIEIKFKVNKDTEKPIFGVGIFTVDNRSCYGTNTFIDHYEIGEMSKGDVGVVSAIVNSLDLVAGTYFLDVAVHDEDGNPYDYHNKKYSFKVSSLTNDVGIAKLKHHWELTVNREVSR